MQNLAQKQLCAFMLRIFEEFFRRIRLYNLPLIHEDHAIGHLPRKAHFMRHANHGHAFLRKCQSVTAWTLHEAAKIGHAEIAWPLPYLSGRGQYETNLKRAVSAAAAGPACAPDSPRLKCQSRNNP